MLINVEKSSENVELWWNKWEDVKRHDNITQLFTEEIRKKMSCVTSQSFGKCWPLSVWLHTAIIPSHRPISPLQAQSTGGISIAALPRQSGFDHALLLIFHLFLYCIYFFFSFYLVNSAPFANVVILLEPGLKVNTRSGRTHVAESHLVGRLYPPRTRDRNTK